MKGQKFVNNKDVIRTASGWLMDQGQACFYTVESVLWENAWSMAFLLEGTMLKSDKIASAFNCVKLGTFERPLYV